MTKPNPLGEERKPTGPSGVAGLLAVEEAPYIRREEEGDGDGTDDPDSRISGSGEVPLKPSPR